MERFLPGRHAIDAFGNGGFRFGGMSHVGSLLVLPSGMRAIDCSTIDDITDGQIDALISERGETDFVIIGSGNSIKYPSAMHMQRLRDVGLHADVMDTNAAVRMYNVVIDERRRVAALLIAVSDAAGR